MNKGIMVDESEKIKKPKRSNSLKGKPRKMTPAILANPGGRPSAFDAAAPKIIAAIRKGNTYDCAAGCAFITYNTFNEWMKEGLSNKENELVTKFSKFYDDVKKAERDLESEIVSHWINQIPQNWQASRDFLARRNPDSWGNKEKMDMKSTVEVSQKAILEIPDNGRRET